MDTESGIFDHGKVIKAVTAADHGISSQSDTVENTSTHPTNSLTESLSPKMTHPASTANTDSRLINNDATVGSVFFLQ